MRRRTLNEIIESIPDNTRLGGGVTSNELRDAFYSMKPPYGSFSMVTPAAATVASGQAGVYIPIQGTTQDNGRNYQMTVTNRRLTYTGDSPRHFHIAVSISFTGAVNATVGFKIAKNGAVLDDTEVTRFVSRVDVGSTALHGDIMLESGDFLELYCTSDTVADTVTVQNLYFFAVGMLV